MGASTLCPLFPLWWISIAQRMINRFTARRQTGCLPISFDGEALFVPAVAPDAAAKDAILKQVWQPYHRARLPLNWHACVRNLAMRCCGMHLIKSVVPRLFEGRLPDLNFGTADGAKLFDAAQPGAAGKLQCVPAVAGYSMAALKADISPVTMAIPSTMVMLFS